MTVTSSFANLQVVADDSQPVLAVLDALLTASGYELEPEPFAGERSVYVSDPVDGWVAVFDSQLDGGAVEPAAWLALRLSAQLHTVVMAWVVHDLGLLIYFVLDNGEVIDRYVSRPDVLRPNADPDAAPAPPLGGDAQLLLDTVGRPGSAARLAAILRRPRPLAQETLRLVAVALGQEHADLGHAHLEHESFADIPLEDLALFHRRDYRRTQP